MARPTKPGLDYFPLNVNFSDDEKIEMIEAEFKETGFYVIVKLFMRIYGNDGYYMMFTSREQKLFSKRINVDINSVIAIINSALNEGLFDKNLYNKYGILTSKGIQTRYLEAVERRIKIELIKEYLLIDVPNTKNIYLKSIVNHRNGVNVINNEINVYNNSIDDDIMGTKNTQSKVKESKYITKLNLTFNLIINNNVTELEIEQNLFDGFIKLLERLEFKICPEQLKVIPKEDLLKFKIIYLTLFALYKSSYQVYLNKLTREKVVNKFAKTEKYIGNLNEIEDEKLKDFMAYFITCLQDDFDKRT